MLTRRAVIGFGLSLSMLLGSVTRIASQDPVAAVTGTWGQPPVDGKPGLTGSILSTYRDADNAARIDLIFAPAGWSCSAHEQAVSWNDAAGRFEWPNQSTREPGGKCWLKADRQGTMLDVQMFCPYSCTKAAEVNALRLAKMAETRLVAPPDVVQTFCSSPDPLRHAMCARGPVQDRIVQGARLADQVNVLSDGLDAKTQEPDTEQALLDVLAACRASAAGVACVDGQLRARADRLRYAVSARQRALDLERRSSEQRAMPLPAAAAPEGWTRPAHLVSDAVISSLRVEDCDTMSCTATIASETNYTFGAAERQGSCSIDAEVRFTSTDAAFGYVAVAESDRDVSGAGPFANFCRIDLQRAGDGFDVGLRGSGCQQWCSEAHFPTLIGRYRGGGTPSFSCADPDSLAWDEKNVCLDPELAALDREMAAAFARARKAATPAASAALARSQRAWLQERHETCNADRRRSCVKELYERRLTELGARAK